MLLSKVFSGSLKQWRKAGRGSCVPVKSVVEILETMEEGREKLKCYSKKFCRDSLEQ